MPSLLDLLNDEPVNEGRTQYTSFGTQLSLGRPKRPFASARQANGRNSGREIKPDRRISVCSLQFGDRISHTLLWICTAVAAELKRFDTLVTEIPVFSRVDGECGFTVWQPRLGPVAVHDLRAQTAVSIEHIKDTAEQENSWKAAVSASRRPGSLR